MAKVYSGIWPTNLQDSAYKMDQNQDKVEYSVTFKFDHYPYTSVAINNQAQALVNSTLQELNRIVHRKFSDHAAPGTFSGIGIENEDD